MIVDVHSHIMWYPDHMEQQFAEEALAAKLVKLRTSGGLARSTRLDLHSYDSTPQGHWKASQAADRVVVFGLQAKATGIWVPNEVVASYVADHAEKLIGWASIDPSEPDPVGRLTEAVEGLGLRGLKLGPAYQHFDPSDRAHWPLYERASKLGIPIMWHQGTTFPTKARLRVASPLLLEDVAQSFPDLRMIVAHLGHPWETDLIVLMRKSPNLFADISAVHYRPWRMWQALITAMEYGVSHKLLLGSDFPSAEVTDVIKGLRAVNDIVVGTRLPTVPSEVIEQVISENWKEVFPEWV